MAGGTVGASTSMASYHNGLDGYIKGGVDGISRPGNTRGYGCKWSKSECYQIGLR